MTEAAHHPQRTFFVTGAGAGIGRSTALAALERGHRVAATSRSTGGLGEVADRFGDQVLLVDADVRDEQALRHAVARTVEEFTTIDVVVNCAGTALFGSVEGTSDEQARALFDTSVFGALNVVRAVLPVLRAQRSGHVVQLSSNFGDTAYPGCGLLAAAKHAVGGFTKALQQELAPLGVSVTLLQPGAVRTGFLAKAALAEATISDYDVTAGATLAQLGALPTEAFLDPARVAEAVLVVAASEAPPLRLVLGRTAEADVRTALAAGLAEMDAWAATTREVEAPV